jgi:hypothetical protein
MPVADIARAAGTKRRFDKNAHQHLSLTDGREQLDPTNERERESRAVSIFRVAVASAKRTQQRAAHTHTDTHRAIQISNFITILGRQFHPH